jgi:hypothetical protein
MNLKKWLFLPILALPTMVKGHHGTGNSMASTSVITPSSTIFPSGIPSLPSDVFHSSTRDSSDTSDLESALKKMTSKTVNEKAAQSTPAGLQTMASKMNDAAGNAGKAAEQVKDATGKADNKTGIDGKAKPNTGAPVGKPDESKSDAAKSSAKVDNASQKANAPGGGLPPAGPNPPGSSPNKGDLGNVD